MPISRLVYSLTKLTDPVTEWRYFAGGQEPESFEHFWGDLIIPERIPYGMTSYTRVYVISLFCGFVRCERIIVSDYYGHEFSMWGQPEDLSAKVKQIWDRDTKCGINLLPSDDVYAIKEVVNEHKDPESDLQTGILAQDCILQNKHVCFITSSPDGDVWGSRDIEAMVVDGKKHPVQALGTAGHFYASALFKYREKKRYEEMTPEQQAAAKTKEAELLHQRVEHLLNPKAPNQRGSNL